MSWGVFLVGCAVVVTLVAWWNPVRRIVFPMPVPPEYDAQLANQHLLVDRTRVDYVIYRPRSGKSRGWILFQHGNASDMGSMDSILRHFADELEWTFVSWEYPGYGYSQGTPNEKSINHSLQLMIEHLTRELNVPLNQLVLYGQSIGTGASVWAAGRYKVAGLILQSPYLSLLEVGKQWYGKYLTHLISFVWNPWNSQQNIRQVDCPVLFLHGERDRLIPHVHSVKLHELAKPGSTLALFKNTYHNWDFLIVVPALRQYLDSIIIPPAN